MQDIEARRAIAHLQGVVRAMERKQADYITSAKDAELKARKRAMVEEMVSIQSRIFDKSATYTTLVMGAGYAGAFTAWSSSAAAFNNKVNGIIGLSLGVSLAAFIFFEVFKVAASFFSYISSSKMIDSPSPPELYYNEIKAFERNERKPKRIVIYTWYVVLFFSVTGGLIAASVMFYNHLAITLDMSQWPNGQMPKSLPTNSGMATTPP